jgi:hypothetical protein
MTSPYRAMCAELLAQLENYRSILPGILTFAVRARALLAQPGRNGRVMKS